MPRHDREHAQPRSRWPPGATRTRAPLERAGEIVTHGVAPRAGGSAGAGLAPQDVGVAGIERRGEAVGEQPAAEPQRLRVGVARSSRSASASERNSGVAARTASRVRASCSAVVALQAPCERCHASAIAPSRQRASTTGSGARRAAMRVRSEASTYREGRPRPGASQTCRTSAHAPRAAGAFGRSVWSGRLGAARIAQDPEQHGLALADVAPAGDRARLGDERLTGAQRGAAISELDLHESATRRSRPRRPCAARPGRPSRAAAGARGRRAGRRRARRAAAGARAAALARVMAARQLIAAHGVAPQELVERDVEARREVEQRVEREARLPALGVRDRARRHACEPARSVWLRFRRSRRLRSATARRAAAGVAVRRTSPSSPTLRVSTLPSTPGGRPSALAMRTRWSSTTSTHCVTSSTSRRSVGERVGASDRPVRDRADLEQHRATAHEEASGDLGAPSARPSHRAGRRRGSCAPRASRYARTAVSSSPGRPFGPVGRGVDDLDRRLPRRGRLAAERDVREGLGLPAGRDERAHERLDRAPAGAPPRPRCRPRTARPACGRGRRCRWLPDLERSSLAGCSHRPRSR